MMPGDRGIEHDFSHWECVSKKQLKDFFPFGLIIEEIEEGPHPKTFLVITDKERRVAQKIREIQEILEED